MICGGLVCKNEIKYELLQKEATDEETSYYAGVLCSKCGFTHRISPFYLKREKAVRQVDVHNFRVANIKGDK